MNKNKLEPRPSATSDHEYMDMRESPAPNEESVRDPNRPQSTVSDDLSKTRGRRDSCAQITDGTLATMTIETSCAFFDTSTQTGEF